MSTSTAGIPMTSSSGPALIGKTGFIYGTAWKKDETTRLVKEALGAGFDAVDTAAQPKHYREELVGKALRDVIQSGALRREQIYVCMSATWGEGPLRKHDRCLV